MTQSHILPIVDITGPASAHLDQRLCVARQLDRACAGRAFSASWGRSGTMSRSPTCLAGCGYSALDPAIKMKSSIGHCEIHSGYVRVGEEQLGTA
jgi:hypothetical protein